MGTVSKHKNIKLSSKKDCEPDISENLICGCCCVSLQNTDTAIKCSVCCETILCVDCWTRGAEIGKHKKTHDFFVLSSQKTSDVSVFPHYPDWTLEDDEQFLDNIEHFGFGNWEDSVTGLSSKNGQFARDHFYDSFLNSNIGVCTLRSRTRPAVADYTAITTESPLSPTLYIPPKPTVDLTQDETQTLGYLAHRDDFEIDYDNEAEKFCCDVKMTRDDDKVDAEFKLSMIDMYARRRRERERRKRIIKNNDFILEFMRPDKSGLIARTRKKQTKDIKDFQDRLRIYSQFQVASQREQFVENMLTEKKCRERIMQLMNYRRNGITKLEDCAEFDDEKYLRDKRKVKKRSGLIIPSYSGNNGSSSKRGTSQSGKLEDKPTEPPAPVQKMEVEKDETKITDDSSYGGVGAANILSKREKRLCQNLGVTPAYYITLKTLIITDNLAQSEEDSGESGAESAGAGINTNKITEDVKDYIHTNSWIH